MKTLLKTYVGAVLTAAILAALATGLLATGASDSHIPAAIWVAGFGVLAELLTYQLPQGGSGSVALIPFVACALISPSWPAVLAVGMAQAVCEIIRRRAGVKAVFNAAQVVLSLALGILAYHAMGGAPVAAMRDYWSVGTVDVGAVIALLLVYVLVNSATVSGVIAISQDLNFWIVWRENTLGTVAYTLVSGLLAYLLAAIYVRWGLVGAALLMVPLIAFRQFYKNTLQLQQTNRELLELMVKAIEARDPYTSGHSRRVADTATVIARGIGLSAQQVERVRIAALLHDIGKIDEVYAPILRKEGKLTAEEWAIMKTHPIKGAELVATLSDLRDIVAPVRHHHERWDGRGYPDGLSQDEIPLGARIITFADTMDALTTDRPYRRAFGEDEVRAEFVKNCGTQFDPTICGHVLSPNVWGQLFPDVSPLGHSRASTVTPTTRRAIAAM